MDQCASSGGRSVPCHQLSRNRAIRVLHLAVFFILLWSNVTHGVKVEADDSDVIAVGSGLHPDSSHVTNYLQTLKRSQEELFKKIDRLTKAVEEKDREDYQFRLKFSRKVHTLESKVLYMEHTFTQKVEQVVQRKVDEMMTAADNRLRYPYYQHHQTISSGSSSSSSPQNSHGTGGGSPDANDDGDYSTTGPQMNIQSHQSSAYNYNNMPYSRYHQYHQPFYHPRQSNTFNYPQNINANNNWGFYEHPITHKRVRDSQPHLFGYEPPTRDLPLISLVATTASAATVPQQQQQFQPLNQAISRDEHDNVKGGGGMEVKGSSRSRTAKGERDAAVLTVPSNFLDETHKKFESYDLTLQSLRENITGLEKEILKTSRYQNANNDYSEVHTLLMETRKDVTGLQKGHQDMVRRIEYFIVEMEKVAAKREHSVNESLKELGSELKKQISAVKAYAKKQIQNITTSTSGVGAVGSSQTPDKLRCAQTLLDEMLAQIGKPTSHRTQMLQYDTIADQAGSQEHKGNERAMFYMSRRSADKPSAESLLKELTTQRKEITQLKSEIGKLNVSQVLLMKLVDEETLKRTVRPRDCTEIRLLRNASSGIYSIFPRLNNAPLEVYCDMQTDGGGWTVIQRRGAPIPGITLDGNASRESFARLWDEYEKGFGTLQGDFWLGLSNIALLCQLGIQELRIDLTNWAGETRFASYQYFKISNASQLYRITVKGYSGTAGDSLSRHNGMAFSTPDQDHDTDPRRHCAKTYSAGWWYYACFESNLNGLYIEERGSNQTYYAFGAGIIWHHWMDNNYSLKSAEMKIRNRFI